MMRSIAFIGLTLLLAGTAPAQYGRYQGQEPVRVTIQELVTTGALYNERPIIVQGELHWGDIQDSNNNIFELRDEESVRFVRVGTAVRSFEDLRFMTGQRVEISGIFFDLQSVMFPERHPVLRYFPGALRQDAVGFDRQYFVAVIHVEVIEPLESDLGPKDPEEEPDIADPDIDVSGLAHVDLRDLLSQPDRYLGRRIAVLGKFRGSNLYGDLSIRDKRTPRDFVIKVADAAIWVTGRRPRGDGFRLDPRKRRDTGEWLRVVGEPWAYEDTVYLRAEKIELAEEPEDPELEPTKVVYEEEEELGPPPEVTFTLPLAGERGIPLDSEFQVQFSKDMKRESFNRNVDLLYADDDGIGNPFPELEVVYDTATRTVTVRPNRQLRPGQEIHLILYDAIEDEEGQKLPVQAAASEFAPGAAVVLSFLTADS